MQRMLCASAVLAPVMALAWVLGEASLFGTPAPRHDRPRADSLEADMNFGRTRALPEGPPINAILNGPQDLTMPLSKFQTLMPELSESLSARQRGLRSGGMLVE